MEKLGCDSNDCYFKKRKNWAIPGLFFIIFVFSTVTSNYVEYRILLMTGFEPRTSGIRGDHSANWATTTALFDSLDINYNPLIVHCNEWRYREGLFARPEFPGPDLHEHFNGFFTWLTKVLMYHVGKK